MLSETGFVLWQSSSLAMGAQAAHGLHNHISAVRFSDLHYRHGNPKG